MKVIETILWCLLVLATLGGMGLMFILEPFGADQFEDWLIRGFGIFIILMSIVVVITIVKFKAE